MPATRNKIVAQLSFDSHKVFTLFFPKGRTAIISGAVGGSIALAVARDLAEACAKMAI